MPYRTWHTCRNRGACWLLLVGGGSRSSKERKKEQEGMKRPPTSYGWHQQRLVCADIATRMIDGGNESSGARSPNASTGSRHNRSSCWYCGRRLSLIIVARRLSHPPFGVPTQFRWNILELCMAYRLCRRKGEEGRGPSRPFRPSTILYYIYVSCQRIPERPA